jgi:hypothetical protein
MRINLLYKGILVAATLCVAPAVFPASPDGSPPDTRSVVSGTGTFGSDASNLLQQIQVDARGVKNDADRLQALTRQPFVVDWHSDAGQLRSIRAQVNHMDKLLSRLRANESEVLPWQQETIDAIEPTLARLTNTTQAAIVSLNGDMEQAQIYYSNMYDFAHDMYNQARQIDKTIVNSRKNANAPHEM